MQQWRIADFREHPSFTKGAYHSLGAKLKIVGGINEGDCCR